MRTILRTAFLATAIVSVAGAANAVVVLGVYNTGVGAGGAPLAAGDGQIDPHYVVVSSNVSSITPGSHALTYYNPAYLQDGPLSRIVNATGNGNGATGEVTTFETTFNLRGYDSTTATLSGQALFDNFGTVALNGHQVGGEIDGFGSLAAFGTNANFFLPGINKIDFTLHNVDGPDAFQVAGLTVTAGQGTGTVPEAAT
jgi:hypothetical protein